MIDRRPAPPSHGMPRVQPVGTRVRRRRIAFRHGALRAVLAIGDTLAISIAASLAPELWAAGDPNYLPGPLAPYWSVVSLPVWFVALRLFVTHQGLSLADRRVVSSVGHAALVVCFVALGLFYLSPFFAPRGATLLSIPVVAICLLAWRLAFARLVSSGMFDWAVAIVGTDVAATRAAEAILRSHPSPYRVVTIITTDVKPDTVLGIPTTLIHEDFWSIVRDLGVDQLVVGNTQGLPASVLGDLVQCFDHGVEATPATRVYEELTGRVLASALELDWYADLPTQTGGLYAAAKRVVDVTVSLALLVVLTPLIIAVGLAVFLDTGRPIILRQVRVGRGGRTFVIHKFRTMRRDAEPNGLAIWSTPDDARITRTGRWLRRARLDELPQLWDVVRGPMSLIGPRPERPEFVERLAREMPLYRARTLVRPGVSGWAQIHHPYAGSLESNLAKLEYDLYYLRHVTMWLDLRIAIATIATILRLRGR